MSLFKTVLTIFDPLYSDVYFGICLSISIKNVLGFWLALHWVYRLIWGNLNLSNTESPNSWTWYLCLFWLIGWGFLISVLGHVLLEAEPMAGFIRTVLFRKNLQGPLNECCRIGKGKEQNRMLLKVKFSFGLMYMELQALSQWEWLSSGWKGRGRNRWRANA